MALSMFSKLQSQWWKLNDCNDCACIMVFMGLQILHDLLEIGVCCIRSFHRSLYVRFEGGGFDQSQALVMIFAMRGCHPSLPLPFPSRLPIQLK